MNKIKQQIKKIKPLFKLYKLLKRIIKPQKETYQDVRKRLEKKDRKSALKGKGLVELHEKLNELKLAQIEHWNSMVYCAGYYYQGYKRIGINGIKPTEPRFKNYDISDYLSNKKTILDIGSNAGWVACYLSEFSKEVEGIELNPYLIEMGEITAEHLNFTNVRFINGDFIKYKFTKKYDIVLSLSNHFTIDGNLNIGFESYVKKIFNILNDGGILFFESHDVNGDDKDMDQKFEIASKYFKLVKYKMVKAFFPQDIDKLFAVFEKRDQAGPIQATNFKLDVAKNQYQYQVKN